MDFISYKTKLYLVFKILFLYLEDKIGRIL